MIAAILGAFFFGTAAFLGSLLGSSAADCLPRLTGAPPPAHAPVPVLIAGSAAVGAAVVLHAGSPLQVLLLAVVCLCLTALWITDARRGIVPDLFTLGPLAVMLLAASMQKEWWIFGSAAFGFVPFAVAALISRGRGMGWGDVKLAALGGAVLGAQTAIFAFGAACLAAAAINYARGRKSGAVAFAPYLAGAIALAIPIGMLQW